MPLRLKRDSALSETPRTTNELAVEPEALPPHGPANGAIHGEPLPSAPTMSGE